jgi:peptidoglycan/LPS O-acetylase OafA/YrhL
MEEGGTTTGGRPHLPHLRGLDGVRAFSVLGVIAFHNGLSSVPGGFYGVDAFFVLSGFLITTLLVTEFGTRGRINLGRFWAGRARRLLPALFLVVIAIGVVLLAAPSVLATPHVIGDAISTIFYASNWYSIHNGVSYFSTATHPSPLLHTWSLAIEEQFYLLWPLIVLAVLSLGTRRKGRRARSPLNRDGQRARTVRVLGGGHLMMFPQGSEHDAAWTRRRRLHLLFALAAFGALASSLLMAHLAPNGYTTRAYYGTDTRAQALLVGAAIAIGVTLWKPTGAGANGTASAPSAASAAASGSWAPWFQRLCAVLGVIGIAGSAVLWTTVNEASSFAFSGGFLLASLAAGLVVLGAVVAPWGLAVRLLEIPPLPALGRISYGVYLWYWPVLLVMSGSRVHLSVYPLFLCRAGVTIAIATASAFLIEIPIRRGALGQWRARVAGPVAAGVAIGLVVISTLVPVEAASIPGSAVSGDVNNSKPNGASTFSALSPPVPTTTTTTVPGTPASSTPSTLVPPPPTGQPIKVLLLGDSMAGSLGVGLAQYESNSNVQIVNEGIPGCSLAMGQEIKVLFYTLPPGPPCSGTDPNAIVNQWQKWVNAYNPDVVIYVARGETFDTEVKNKWTNLGEADYNQYVADRYSAAIKVLGSRGATVVLLTTPYYDSGTSPSGVIWPEDATSRVTTDNQIIRTVAKSATIEDGHQVYVFDLNTVVDPNNAYAANLDSVPLRCGDGVHFTPPGGVFVGLQLLPDVAQLGLAHRTASPSGAWPGHLPPSTPTWYPKLPCG